MEIVFQPNLNFSPQEAARFAEELFGVAASPRELPSERDQNFLLESQTWERFVLKIANPGEAEELLDFQNKAVQHIAAQGEPEIVPTVLPSRNGEVITQIEEEGKKYFVRLLTYLPGWVLAEINPRTPELLHSLGAFMGRIDNALEGFSHPPAGRKLKWDLENSSWIKDYTHHIRVSGKRDIVEHFLSKFETRVVPSFPDLRWSVIHNDGSEYNILVDDTDPYSKRVTGIIDFGDMVGTAAVCELANAAAYAIFDTGDPLAAAAQVAAGRITDDDICLLEENNRQEQEIVLSSHSDASAQSYRKGYDLNLEFHLTIARASGNNRLVDLLEKLLNELERILAHDPYIAEPQQHAEILEGLKRRDKLGSQEAMKKHLEDTKNRSLSGF